MARLTVPRRPRPPLTAREIAAYLSGTRAVKRLEYADLTEPEIESLALELASEDSPMLQHFDIEQYVYWFSRGYQTAWWTNHLCP